MPMERMNGDYISREAAIAEIEEWHDMYPDSDAAREALSLAKRAIRKIPAADVRPVRRGKWTRCKNWTRCVCSACSWEITFVTGNSYNFCPNCGADMRGESDV